MQSADYVPGVSGWKMHKEGQLEVNGSVRVVLGEAAEDKPEPRPFIVVDGVTYISEAEVERGTISNTKIADSYSVKMQTSAIGQYAAGIGVDLDSQFLVSADKFAINGRDTSDIIRDIGALIAETALASRLAETVKEVIRTELQPGGILHRK